MKVEKTHRVRTRKEDRIRLNVGILLLVFGIFLFLSLLVLFPRSERMHEQAYYLFFIATFAVFYCGLFLLVERPYKRAMHYLSLSLNYIWGVIAFFAFSVLLGFFFAPFLGLLNELLKQLISQTEGLNVFQLFEFIFVNNAKVSFVGLISGVFLGIWPALNVFLNGLVLGYVFNLTWSVAGWQEFWRILPHGVFELPAVFISLALGIRLGTFVFVRGRLDVLKERARESLLVFIFVVIPLLFLAAIIESVLIAFSQ